MQSSKLKIPNIYARDVATILGINPHQTAYELLEDKIEYKHPFFIFNKDFFIFYLKSRSIK